VLQNLKPIFTREKHPLQSTDFSFSRFLVPYLSGYKGWSLFCDCDMLMLDDIANLWALCDDRYAVQVVQHNHKPKEDVKFLDKAQTRYEKKNWSSVILFNNAKCHALNFDNYKNCGYADVWFAERDRMLHAG
jgi:lipopolysaccharide biosynthesis glycosyltransferase